MILAMHIFFLGER